MSEPVEWLLNAVTPPAVFRRTIEHNMGRGLEEIEVEEPKEGPLYIVGSGPSLRDTWHELVGCNGEIWALNAAYDYLVHRDIRPTYGVCLAPEEPVTRYFQQMGEGDKFLFSTTTHPELIDRALARGGEVKLWHSAQPAGWDLPCYSGKPRIYGGGTIGTRAIDLAWTLGWRDVHLLGIDACISLDGRLAVDQPFQESERDKIQTFICNGRPFLAYPSHARQVEDFASVLRPLLGMNVTLYGDGMLQWSQRPAQITQPN